MPAHALPAHSRGDSLVVSFSQWLFLPNPIPLNYPSQWLLILFSLCQPHTTKFSLRMSLMKIFNIFLTFGHHNQSILELNAMLFEQDCTPQSPLLFLWQGQMHVVEGMKQGKERRRRERTEVLFSSCSFHYSQKVVNQIDELQIYNLFVHTTCSSIVSYFVFLSRPHHEYSVRGIRRLYP